MNVFLDSTELYNDPFLKKYWHRLLLKICEKYDYRIFISRVVIDETKNNVKKEISLISSEYKQRLSKLEKRLKLNDVLNKEIPYSVSIFEQEYNARYIELEQRGLIEIIEPDDALLSEVIYRGINRKKPFSEDKDEFRDCVIWLSYVNEAEVEDLDECYFISDNTKDFYNKDKNDLHDELKNDTDRFKVYKTIEELIKKERYIECFQKEIETQEWVQQENIDYDYIHKLINDNLLENVQSYVQDYLTHMQPYDIDENYHEVGNIFIADIVIDRITDLDIDIIEDEILCWGIIDIIGELEIEEYNPMADTSSEKYIYKGSRTIKIKALYNLVFTKDKTINEFTLDNIDSEVI